MILTVALITKHMKCSAADGFSEIRRGLHGVDSAVPLRNISYLQNALVTHERLDVLWRRHNLYAVDVPRNARRRICLNLSLKSTQTEQTPKYVLIYNM